MRVILLLLTLFLHSCSVTSLKDMKTDSMLSTPSLAKTTDKSLNSSFFAQGDWPDEMWWKVFKSDELNNYVEAALKQNPSIQSLEQKITLARQEAVVARAKLFPLVFFDAEDNWSYLSRNGLYKTFNPDLNIHSNLIDLSIGFTYEFDFWGKYRNLFQAALGRQKTQEAELSQIQLITSTSIAQAYFALKTNKERRTLYERLYQVRKKKWELEKLLEQKSLLSRLDPIPTAENVLEAQKLLSAIEKEVAVDEHLLNILMGRGPDEPLDVSPICLDFTEKLKIPENISLNLMARRPDLMAQIWRLESLAHGVGAAKADFLPNINLAGLLGLETTIAHLLFKPQSVTTQLLPALNLPIFTAGAIRANVRAKKAAFENAIYDYNHLILQSVQEIADILAFSRSIFEQKTYQNSIVQDAKKLYDLSVLCLEKGLYDQLSVYTVQEKWIEKELDNVSLLYNQYLASIKLIKALGGGYHSEYKEKSS
jgi:NodT family efflux transporter outer membrane factor (OMF) lipoprotein